MKLHTLISKIENKNVESQQFTSMRGEEERAKIASVALTDASSSEAESNVFILRVFHHGLELRRREMT